MTEHVDRLSKAGWHEGRSVDHRPALDRLESEGHLLADWFPSVVSEFDGVALSFNRNGRDDQVVLEPAEAGRRWYPATIASYAERVGCSVVLPMTRWKVSSVDLGLIPLISVRHLAWRSFLVAALAVALMTLSAGVHVGAAAGGGRRALGR